MGQTILVTGGTSGIGLATTELLVGRGWEVLATGRSAESVESAQRMLPPAAEAVRADAASEEDSHALAERIAERFGRLDAVFLNAGITRPAPIESTAGSDLAALFATNTVGPIHTIRAVLPLMRDPSSIVMTTGVGTVRGVPGQAATVASRGALLAMIPTLARELAPRGIRVNGVSPGAIDTPIWSRGGLAAERLDAVKASAAERIPLGRLGTALDVAAAVAFLVSDDAAYITGQNLAVDGGLST